MASDLPAFAAVLDGGRTGLLFETGSPGGCPGPLLELVSDPERRASLRAVGLARARVFDWNVVADRIMAVYETVIAGADGEPADPPQAVGSPRARRPRWRQLMGTVDVLQLATFIVILVIGIAWYLSYSAAASTACTPRSRRDVRPRRGAGAPRRGRLELANSGVLDPASALLIADAATESIERTTEQPVTGDLLDGQHFGGREQVESDLSEALRAALTGEVVVDLRGRDEDLVADALDRIASSGLRVQLARRSTTTPPARCAGCGPSARCGCSGCGATPSCPSRSTFDDELPPALAA